MLYDHPDRASGADGVVREIPAGKIGDQMGIAELQRIKNACPQTDMLHRILTALLATLEQPPTGTRPIVDISYSVWYLGDDDLCRHLLENLAACPLTPTEQSQIEVLLATRHWIDGQIPVRTGRSGGDPSPAFDRRHGTVMMAQLENNAGLGGANVSQGDVGVSRSTDGGRTWSEPVTVFQGKGAGIGPANKATFYDKE